MTMNANELSTRSSLPGKPKSEWAQAAGNVSADFLMNGETNHATAELIVYDYSITNGVTNALVTLTGHPVVSNRNGDMHGDVITCDLIRNTIAFRNYGGSILLQKTNAPGLMDQFKPSRTNSAPNAMNGERK